MGVRPITLVPVPLTTARAGLPLVSSVIVKQPARSSRLSDDGPVFKLFRGHVLPYGI
jgi:hypothetical protein